MGWGARLSTTTQGWARPAASDYLPSPTRPSPTHYRHEALQACLLAADPHPVASR